jgi:hypothetical protein
MTLYDFTLILSGADVMTEDMAEAIVAAGCDDGSPGSSEGTAFVVMHRQADCLETAIRSAIADVQRAGFSVLKVEIAADAPALHIP